MGTTGNVIPMALQESILKARYKHMTYLSTVIYPFAIGVACGGSLAVIILRILFG